MVFEIKQSWACFPHLPLTSNVTLDYLVLKINLQGGNYFISVYHSVIWGLEGLSTLTKVLLQVCGGAAFEPRSVRRLQISCF